jgi:hypothetical protein
MVAHPAPQTVSLSDRLQLLDALLSALHLPSCPPPAHAPDPVNSLYATYARLRHLPSHTLGRDPRSCVQDLRTPCHGLYADPMRSSRHIQPQPLGTKEEAWVLEQDTDEEGQEAIDAEAEEGTVESEPLRGSLYWHSIERRRV